MDDSMNPFENDLLEDQAVSIALSPDANPPDPIPSPLGAGAEFYSAERPLPPPPAKLSLDAVAKRLLEEGFVLTALELHTELVESGRELQRLRDYFSNPANFELPASTPLSAPGRSVEQMIRSSSIQTFDSIDDLAPSSDDGERQAEDKIAVLEFELRKAKATIKTLRGQLTTATENSFCDDSKLVLESEAGTSVKQIPRSLSGDPRPTIVIPLNSYEQKAINFLVNEYLLRNDYKLTSVTFSEEVGDQDFDDWDDVGVNIPRPVDLLSLYREFARITPGCIRTADASSQVNLDAESNPFQEHQQDPTALLNRLNDENGCLLEKNGFLSAEVDRLRLKVEELEKTVEEQKRTIVSLSGAGTPNVTGFSTSGETQDASREGLSVQTGDTFEPVAGSSTEWHRSRKIPPAFKQHALSMANRLPAIVGDNRLLEELSNVGSSWQHFVLCVSRCLPHIVPNVLLNKRDELIPIIVGVVLLHPDDTQRDSLLNMLFNLIKKPEDHQRQVILSGCVAFAIRAGSVKTESELLPQCWEQINHKYVERRLLVAEACGVLAQYLAPSVLSSLVLSMLQQMVVEDKSELVRQAAARSLASLCLFIEDKDKYNQTSELTLKIVMDPEEFVSSVGRRILLPCLGLWSRQTDFLSTLTDLLAGKISQILQTSGINQHANESLLYRYWDCLGSLSGLLYSAVLETCCAPAGLLSSIPKLETDIVSRYPTFHTYLDNPATYFEDADQFKTVTAVYDKYTSEEWFETWDYYDYATKTLFSQLVDCVGKLEVSVRQAVRVAVGFFQRVCRLYGRPYTVNRLKPLFRTKLNIAKDTLDQTDDLSHFPISCACLPVYVAGVLAAYVSDQDKRELYRFLKDCALQYSSKKGAKAAIVVSFVELSGLYPDHGLIMDLVWELIMQKSVPVRSLCASLLHALIPLINEDLVASKVVPGLVTLASDSEIQVQIETVHGFGAVLEIVSQKELDEKVRMQLASFFDEQVSGHGSVGMLLALLRMFTNCAPNLDAQFREEFVLPRLTVTTAHNQHQSNVDQKSLVAVALFEAYSALSCCYLSDACLQESFLPGLRALQRDLDPERSKVAGSILREFQIKLETHREQSAAGNLPAASVVEFPMDVGVVRAKMKDGFKNLRDRMDQKKETVPNIFKKK